LKYHEITEVEEEDMPLYGLFNKSTKYCSL